MKTKIIITACFILTTYGCAGGYAQDMQSWVGAPSDAVLSQWGPPDRDYPMSNGGKILEFSQGGNGGVLVCHPSRPICFDRQFSGCTTRFSVNPAGFVTEAAWEGRC